MEWKYQIWCEAGLLHECDGYETEEEAIEEAKRDLESYPNEDNEYWYEVNS